MKQCLRSALSAFLTLGCLDRVAIRDLPEVSAAATDTMSSETETLGAAAPDAVSMGTTRADAAAVGEPALERQDAGALYEPEARGPCVNDPGLRPPAPASPVLGTGNTLVANESAWVDRTSNGVGIQGGLYPSYLEWREGKHCFVDNDTYETSAVDLTQPIEFVGLYLNQNPECFSNSEPTEVPYDLPPGGQYGMPYNASVHRVTGFGFELRGTTNLPLRFAVKAYQGVNVYCSNLPPCGDGCSVQVALSELELNCWAPGGPPPDPTFLEVIEWQLMPSAGPSASAQWDLCLENLTAIVSPQP